MSEQEEVNLLNGALGRFGGNKIGSLTDGTPNANWCLTYYANLRRALLDVGTWSFAEARVALVQTPTAPAFEYAFTYALPSDIIRIKSYNGSQLQATPIDPLYWMHYLNWYKIEGQVLLSNDGVVFIQYVKDITNPSLWSPLFYQTLQAWLASVLCSAILKNAAMAQGFLKEAMSVYLPLAAAVDAQQNPTQPYVVDDLTWGRW